MKKLVRYKGESRSFLGCSSTEELVKGNVYEVVSEEDHKWQKDYELKGIEGFFNSIWFDEIFPIMAISADKPIIGQTYKCSKVQVQNGCIHLYDGHTGLVNEIIDIGNNIYRITTGNSIYIVQVG